MKDFAFGEEPSQQAMGGEGGENQFVNEGDMEEAPAGDFESGSGSMGGMKRAAPGMMNML